MTKEKLKVKRKSYPRMARMTRIEYNFFYENKLTIT